MELRENSTPPQLTQQESASGPPDPAPGTQTESPPDPAPGGTQTESPPDPAPSLLAPAQGNPGPHPASGNPLPPPVHNPSPVRPALPPPASQLAQSMQRFLNCIFYLQHKTGEAVAAAIGDEGIAMANGHKYRTER